MIRVRQVKLPIESNDIIEKVAKVLRVSKNEIHDIKIIKKSLDARNKNRLMFVYEVDVKVSDENKVLKHNHCADVFKAPNEEYKFVHNDRIKSSIRPIIVGAGPAGLYCAYLLAEHGYNPLVIERGEKVENRVKSIEEFWKTGKLNINSNVQFGEGGAGTFSDGKLNTLVRDKENRIKKVLEIFVENGAPEEILYEAKPHIGTDILRNVVKNIREKIISWGGEFRYNTCLTDVLIKDNKIVSIQVNNDEEINTEVLVLAIGHSARDTFELLKSKKMNMEAKPFAIGVRIQHPQKMINKSQYGSNVSEFLTPASYKLTYKSKNGRGVYSFCMCPGGYVVNASSEEKRLVVNGMSNYQRESENANSAIVVTIDQNDFGNEPLSGMYYQRMLEERAYKVGDGNIPIQLYKDYKAAVKSTELGEVKPITKGNYQFADLNEIFPESINDSLKEGIDSFGNKILGFNRDDAILLGIESRTSSPVRIIRDDDFESNIRGIYPCGEGAGYAGGITTSAVDGIKVAEKIASKYGVI